jgi:8-amino-7-oxononanoate synthase
MDRLHELEIYTPNRSGFPLIEVPLANHEDIDEVGRYLFDRGIYVTMAAYPLVPKDEVGFRIQVTAANGDDEIDRLCDVLGELDARFRLQHEEHQELALQARLARG